MESVCLTKHRTRPASARMRRPCCATRCQNSKHVDKPLVKICGVTNPEDALFAAKAGADFVGMIMWPKAKRAVSDEVARQIALVAKQHGAQPVGVFVDEKAAVIADRCKRAGISVAQLHGDGARASLAHLPPDLSTVYVLNCQPDGTPQTPLPSEIAQEQGQHKLPDWILIDGLQGGAGLALDWANLQTPIGESKQGWMLAGGLNPGNIATAIKLAGPTVVDVSSGVCGPDGLRKDFSKVEAFIRTARGN